MYAIIDESINLDTTLFIDEKKIKENLIRDLLIKPQELTNNFINRIDETVTQNKLCESAIALTVAKIRLYFYKNVLTEIPDIIV